MPMPANTAARTPSPRSRRRARLRDDHTEGASRYGNARTSISARTSSSDHVVDFLQAAAAGQAEEDLRELRRPGRRAAGAVREGAELGDRAVRDDPSLQNDADPVA